MNFVSIQKVLLSVALVSGCLYAQDFNTTGAPASNGASLDGATQPAPATPVAAPAPQPVQNNTNVYVNTPPVYQPVANEAMYRQQFANGSSTQTLGRFMSWGGLLATMLGNFTVNPTLGGVGALVMMIGIPINGAGSSKMVESVNSLNPTLHLEHRGWIPYGIGVGAIVFGYYTAISGVSEYDDSIYADNDAAEQKVITGLLLAAAGEICMLVGWYKFSASADDASAGYATVQVSAGPLLIPDVKGPGVAKGMQLAAAF